MKKLFVLLLLTFLFLNAYSANVVFNFLNPPAEVCACSVNHFEAEVITSLPSVDFTLVLTIENNGSTMLTEPCSDCTPGSVFPVHITNLSVDNALHTLNPLGNGTYELQIYSFSGSPVISFDYVIDCSVTPPAGSTTFMLAQNWSITSHTINSNADYHYTTNLNYASMEIPVMQPAQFFTNYWEPLSLDFHYIYNGSCPAYISFNFSNPDPVLCGAVESTTVEYWINGSGPFTFTEGDWVNLTVPLNTSDELIIYQKSDRVTGCLDDCLNKNATFKWHCAYADSYSLCNECPVNLCEINYAIQYNEYEPDLVLQRLSPAPYASGYANDTAKYDNSCSGDPVHWKYRVENVAAEGTSPYFRFGLSYETNGGDFGIQQMTYVPLSSISYQIYNCIDCVVLPDHAITMVTDPSCNMTNSILTYTLVVKNVTPGASIEFEFDTYKCCDDNPDLYNLPKYYNQYFLRARGETECDLSVGNYIYPSFLPNDAMYTHTNTWFYWAEHFSGGFISPHGDIYTLPNLNQTLSFTPTVTDMSVPPGLPEGDPFEFYVETLGLISTPDQQLLGINSANNSTLHGILRARISCENGLKINNIPSEVSYSLLTDPDIFLTPAACYSSIAPGTCDTGDYYIYYDLSDPNALDILNGGKFDFWLTPCCNGTVEPVVSYSVSFDLLLNNDQCYDFNQPPVIPGTCIEEPLCSDPCWLPLSQVDDDINLHCPGCKAPGVIVSSYRIVRKNLGYPDVENDRIPDEPVLTPIDPASYYQIGNVRMHQSSQGDLLEDKMVAFFQDGDNTDGGYTYADMTAGGDGKLKVLQLSRDMMYSELMGLEIESFTLYIDDLYPGNPNPSTCLECAEYNIPPGSFTTVVKMCVPFNDALSTGMLYIHPLNSETNRYFFTFHISDLNTYDCGGLSGFSEFKVWQKYRLKANYKVCKNFTAPIDAADIEEVRKTGDITNLMWLSGIEQSPTVQTDRIPGNVFTNFQMPNEAAGVVTAGYHLNDEPLYDDDFVNDFVFYCETFGGVHYFVTTNIKTISADPTPYDVCNPSFEYHVTAQIGAGNFNNMFPFEYKIAPLSLSQLELDVPDDWNLNDIKYWTKYYNEETSEAEMLGISAAGGTLLTIPPASIPPLECRTSSTPLPAVHYESDEYNTQVLEFFFSPVDDCEEDIAYTFTAPDIKAIHTINSNNCLGNVTQACSPSVITEFNPIPPYPQLILPDPNLEINFGVTSINVGTYQACWSFDLTNFYLDEHTDASNVFIAVPLLPYLSDWELNINCYPDPIPGSVQGGFVFFNIGSVVLGSDCDGMLCATLMNCPIPDVQNFNIYYGYDCYGIDVLTDPLDACVNTTVEFGIQTPETSVVDSEILPGLYNLCEDFPVIIELASDAGGYQPNVISIGALPAGLDVSGWEIYNCTGLHPPILVGAGVSTYTITPEQLILLGFEGSFLSLGDALCVKIIYNGGCEYEGDLPDVEVEGINFCGQPLNIETITFSSMGAPAGSLCECLSCDKLSLNTEDKGDCTFSFIAVVPPSDCATEIIEWDFDDGTTGYGVSVSHQYSLSGSYKVCYNYVCIDEKGDTILECRVCDGIKVECPAFCARIANQNYFDVGVAIQPASDKGLVLTGTMRESSTDDDIYFAKVDQYLTDQFCYRIGDPGSIYKEAAYSVLEHDGKFYITGEAKPENGQHADVFVACINVVDNQIDWAKIYPGPKHDVGVKILYMPDVSAPENDRLLVVGFTGSMSPDGNMDIMAMRIKPSTGGLEAIRIYYMDEHLYNEYSNDAIKMKDGNQFAIVGRVERSSVDHDVLAFKIDYNLNVVSNTYRTYGHSGLDVGFGLIEKGSYVYLVGRTNSSLLTTGSQDIYLIETDKTDLAMNNSRTFGFNADSDEEGFKIIETKDDQLAIVGTMNFNAGSPSYTDGLIMKIRYHPSTALHLNPFWSMRTTGPFNDYLFGLSNDHDHLLATGSYGMASNDGDIFIIKLSSEDGMSCCLKPIEFERNKGGKTGTPPYEQVAAYWAPDDHLQLDDEYDLQPVCLPHEKGRNVEFQLLNDESKGMNIYPNPTTGKFEIELIRNKDEQINSVNIYDVTGRRIHNISVVRNGLKEVVDLKNASVGIYFVEVITNDGKKLIGKVSLTK